MKIPDNYLPVMPYIIVDKSAGFLSFTKKVFGATEQMIIPGEQGKIMHGEIRIFDAVIMFANATENFSEKTSGMFIYVENVNSVYQKALDEKAVSLTAPAQQDYGFTAGFQDPYGNQWWIVEA